MDINEHAVLVRLSISTKGLLGERKDDGASEMLVHTYRAKDDKSIAGKVVLLNQRADSIRAVRATAHAARVHLYNHTMPWGDRENHLLPLNIRRKFEKEMGNLLQAHEDAKEDFFKAYPSLVRSREKRREIGGLFRKDNYPSTKQIRTMFKCELLYSPVPTSDHFIANVTDKMKKALDQSVADRVLYACNTLVDRAETRIREYVDKLERYSGSRDGRFNDTLVSNLTDVGSLIRELNFTNDSGINQLASNVDRLGKFTAQTLRENDEVRKGAIKEGKSLLSRLEAYKKIDKDTDTAFDQMAEIEI
jgi:hypothetical protein